MPAVRFTKQSLNVVTGVSGAGKSTLTLALLYENALAFAKQQTEFEKIQRRQNFEAKSLGKTIKATKPTKFNFRFCDNIEGLEGIKSVHLIDRKPVAKSSVSMPATYLDVFGILRDLYGQLPDAQVAGIDAASFSLAREGGRCENCGGRGEVNLQMRFLADARIKCEVCNGRRYRPHVLEIRYNGLSLSDVLDLTIDETLTHFATFTKIKKLLAPAVELGLGYLKLGQPSASLSGGEAQRLKLVPFFVKSFSAHSLVVLDEPTTGLHFQDVERLLTCLRKLTNQGATVILVEHNLDMIKAADWLVELGPGSATQGGELMFEGPSASPRL